MGKRAASNNADYGLTLQKIICDSYGLEVNDHAAAQFASGYDGEYREELEKIIPLIFSGVGAMPVKLLTYTGELTHGLQMTSPHNFLLDDGRTLSIRTTKTSDKVAPKTVGQAGFAVLNEYFGDVYGSEIKNQEDIRRLVYNHIHEILPVFIDNLFQSDVTVFISRKNSSDIQVIRSEELASYSFDRRDFEFTRALDEWKESITLKYHGKSIAEVQTHANRTFKFRFVVSSIPEWFRTVRESNETLGMSAEAAVCDFFGLGKPESFKTRTSRKYVSELMPVVKAAFGGGMPAAVMHCGSMKGARGEQSKSPYDFLLEGNKTLSLKTNKGKMVCPPEVGQPGAKTCLLYFGRFFEDGTSEVDGEAFKKMVLGRIDEIMPIYVEHLFDSDWLLWIYETGGGYKHMEISRDAIKKFTWEKERFSFTKASVREWNESNTVKYDGISIGEFQVHRNRGCYKFRFNMHNLLELILY